MTCCCPIRYGILSSEIKKLEKLRKEDDNNDV